MKKLFAILMAVCLMATALCVTALAADEPAAPAEGTVMRVSLQKKGGTSVLAETPDYTKFAEGWNYAMALATDFDMLDENGYHRVVVDLYANWTATETEFGSGDGFKNDTIQFPSETRVTLNLNGHTVNRGLTKYQRNGEVFYIGTDADVIINDGTVTGGFSCNGAGGIHIDDDATVTLNNVNVIGNKVEDDDGAGIAIYDDATLTMTGGSISNNLAIHSTAVPYGCGIYTEDSTVILNSVKIENNQCSGYAIQGVAIYSADSDVTMNRCTVKNNGILKKDESNLAPRSIIFCDADSTLAMTNCGFHGNSSHWPIGKSPSDKPSFSADDTPTLILNLYGATATITDCAFDENNAMYLINCSNATLIVSGGDIQNNYSSVFRGYCKKGSGSYFSNVTVGNNHSKNVIFNFNSLNELTFQDCDLGSSTFNDKSRATFGNASTGSIVGEGSLSVVLAIVALVVSGVSFYFCLSRNKKTSQPAKDETAE